MPAGEAEPVFQMLSRTIYCVSYLTGHGMLSVIRPCRLLQRRCLRRAYHVHTAGFPVPVADRYVKTLSAMDDRGLKVLKDYFEYVSSSTGDG